MHTCLANGKKKLRLEIAWSKTELLQVTLKKTNFSGKIKKAL